MNAAMKAAYEKGVIAAARGEARESNPYDYNKVVRGGPTWARAFHRCWNEGYDAEIKCLGTFGRRR